MELKERQRWGLPSSVKLALSPLFEASLAAFSLFFSCCSRIRKICTVNGIAELISGISDKKGRISEYNQALLKERGR